MSQHMRALKLIDKESGLEGLILRPLSAAYLKPTEPERKGLVDRSKLLDISGRSRNRQISLASGKGIKEYPCPSGGCLLTDKNFAERIRDYFAFTQCASMKDIPLLKVGRHFRLKNGDKVIVGRNELECRLMKKLCASKDHFLSPLNFPGPAVILQGKAFEAAMSKMLEYTKKLLPRHSYVKYRHNGKSTIIPLDEIIRNGRCAFLQK